MSLCPCSVCSNKFYKNVLFGGHLLQLNRDFNCNTLERYFQCITMWLVTNCQLIIIPVCRRLPFVRIQYLLFTKLYFAIHCVLLCMTFSAPTHCLFIYYSKLKKLVSNSFSINLSNIVIVRLRYV